MSKRLLTLMGGTQKPGFRDTFTDTDAVSLADHKPDYDSSRNGWTLRENTITIQSNSAKGTGLAAQGNLATFDIGKSDGSVECYITSRGGANAYAVLRYTDINNWWGVGVRISTSSFRILKVEGGVASVAIEVGALGLASDIEYKINYSFTGVNIIATLDDANEIAVADATLNQTATKHGIRLFGESEANSFFLA